METDSLKSSLMVLGLISLCTASLPVTAQDGARLNRPLSVARIQELRMQESLSKEGNQTLLIQQNMKGEKQHAQSISNQNPSGADKRQKEN